MNNIYLPIDLNNNNCAYIYDKDTIRVLDNRPTYNTNINYKDYFINSHYIYREGSVQYGSYSNLPTCLNNNIFTKEYYYRNDFADIIIIWFFVGIFVYFIPLKLWRRLFRRFN